MTEFPNIKDAKIIGFDTETYDPCLIKDGPGWARECGHLVGVSLSTGSASWYFPLRHEYNPEQNMDIDKTLSFLRDVLGSNTIKIGANVMYDIGWLAEDGVNVSGEVFDVQFAEALLDSNAMSVSLDSLAKKYLGKTKEDDILYAWCHAKYGGKKGRPQASNIYRAPPKLVSPYAEQDALLAIKVFLAQAPLLEKYGLEEVFRMECRLVQLLVAMRQRGMPVDLDKAEGARKKLLEEEEAQRKKLKEMTGFNVNINSRKDLKKVFDALKIDYPYTQKGNPSFTGAWLSQQKNPVASKIVEIRRTHKTRSDFIEKAILDKSVKGKIFPSLHPLRGTDGGTVTGRFSSSKPNGQQFPSRDEKLARLVRGVFVPEQGYPLWCKMDHSQIEYRMFAHYSDDANLVEAYCKNNEADFHAIVCEMLGVGTSLRVPVKNINFMMLYGGGKKKVEQMLSALDINMLPSDFISLYNKKFPAARLLRERISKKVEKTTEVRTLLNRRISFNLWEPENNMYSDIRAKALNYQEALRLYGSNLKVAGAYKGCNYLLQGSAADFMKKGLLDAWDAGVFERTGVPHITVHDEIDLSYHPDLENDFKDLQKYMEEAIKLKVPVIMDVEKGSNWGSVK